MFRNKNGFLKKGDALTPLVFNFALYCAIKSVQVNQNGWKLNCTYLILFCADDVNKLGGRIHTIKTQKL
jgi:hypothetical protein